MAEETETKTEEFQEESTGDLFDGTPEVKAEMPSPEEEIKEEVKEDKTEVKPEETAKGKETPSGLLFAKPADTKAKNKWGKTPLIRTENKAAPEIVDILRKHGRYVS